MKLFKMTHKLGEPFAKDINLATDSTVLVGFNWVDENGDAYNPDEGSLEVNGEAPTIVEVEGVAYTCWNVSAGDAAGTTEYVVTWEKDESPFECTFRVVTADRNVAEVGSVGGGGDYGILVISGITEDDEEVTFNVLGREVEQ